MRGLVPGALLIAVLLCAQPAAALDDGLARTPPMGWSSWNRFNCDIDERIVRETADRMVTSGMRARGYRYVLLDDCWSGPKRSADGALQPDFGRFPSGIKALADYVHRRGLRFGLYHDLGARACNGGPGIAGHERRDMRQFASWGVDYVKVDFCYVDHEAWTRPARAYARVRDAIRASGRRMVFGVCNWGRRQPWRWAPRMAHLWRTTYDIEHSWRSILHIADRTNELHAFAGPGRWNDPDVVVAGNAGVSDSEGRAQVSLWAILAAPLVSGTDVRNMSWETAKTLLNSEVVAVDQDRLGRQGRRVWRRAGHEVWVRRLRGGERAVLLLNRREDPARISAPSRMFGLRARSRRVRDLWARRWLRTGPTISARVPGHSARLFRVAP
jgi:alpha-galactosidase